MRRFLVVVEMLTAHANNPVSIQLIDRVCSVELQKINGNKKDLCNQVLLVACSHLAHQAILTCCAVTTDAVFCPYLYLQSCIAHV